MTIESSLHFKSRIFIIAVQNSFSSILSKLKVKEVKNIRSNHIYKIYLSHVLGISNLLKYLENKQSGKSFEILLLILKKLML